MQGPVWKYFYEISGIPRGSGNEEGIRRYILEFADKHRLDAERDKAGNVVIRKPGSPGRENEPALAIQGHLDMVCEKNGDVDHDFKKDPIKLVTEGGWLTADGTTLGADNGIAVAMGMALLADDTISRPPLEMLFTVDEESGMTGAFGLQKGFISAGRLINLDSEEEGYFYIGCAGGIHTDGKLKFKLAVPQDGFSHVNCSVTGLNGGHSGMEINRGLGNAIRIAGLVLDSYPGELLISSMKGGEKANAIPRECAAGLYVDDPEAFASYLVSVKSGLAGQYPLDTRINIGMTPSKGGKCLSAESTKRLLGLITSVPNGPLSMDPHIEGLVETSSNLASVKLSDGICRIVTSQRSSDTEKLNDVKQRIAEEIRKAGGSASFESGYPGWKPDPDSPLLEIAKKAYESFAGVPPVVTAVHAGLECGLLGERFPGLDMISFGPDILGAHSPDEKVNIASVGRTWEYLLVLLESV